MSLGIGIAIGVAVAALIIVVVLRAGRSASRDQSLQLEPYVPVKEITDDEFWALYWQRRVGVRRENKVVRTKSTNVILFGDIPISPNHSRWVYDLERNMLEKKLITQPTGKNWLPTDEGKRALDARLGKEEKPAKPIRPLVSAETLQNVDLSSPKR